MARKLRSCSFAARIWRAFDNKCGKKRFNHPVVCKMSELWRCPNSFSNWPFQKAPSERRCCLHSAMFETEVGKAKAESKRALKAGRFSIENLGKQNTVIETHLFFARSLPRHTVFFSCRKYFSSTVKQEKRQFFHQTKNYQSWWLGSRFTDSPDVIHMGSRSLSDSSLPLDCHDLGVVRFRKSWRYPFSDRSYSYQLDVTQMKLLHYSLA